MGTRGKSLLAHGSVVSFTRKYFAKDPGVRGSVPDFVNSYYSRYARTLCLKSETECEGLLLLAGVLKPNNASDFSFRGSLRRILPFSFTSKLCASTCTLFSEIRVGDVARPIGKETYIGSLIHCRHSLSCVMQHLFKRMFVQ